MIRSLSRGLAWLHQAPGQSRLTATAPAPWRRVWPVALLGFLVAAVLVGTRVGMPEELDATVPFQVGSEWGLAEQLAAQGGPVTSDWQIGYDGQWFLGQAYDPLLRSEIVTTFDRPQYRALRMLFPTAGWLAAAGQPPAVPYALLLLSMVAVGLGCAACARVVTAYGRSRWWGALFAAIPGVVVGVMYATAEPVGVAFAALGLSLLVDRRYVWAGLAFAGAALTKETYLAFALVAAVFVAVDGGLRAESWRAWTRRAAAVAAPGMIGLVGWWAYISGVVPDSQRTPNHLLEFPFAGWWGVFGTISRGEYAHSSVLGPAVLAAAFLVLVAALALALRLRQTVLAYAVLLWSVFSLCLVSIMLERFLSSQRVLAPAMLVALLWLVTAWPSPARGRRPDATGPPAPPPPDRPDVPIPVVGGQPPGSGRTGPVVPPAREGERGTIPQAGPG